MGHVGVTHSNISGLDFRAGNPQCRKLKGTANRHRIRVGDYRVVYDVSDKELKVLIIRVRHRKDAYD